MMHRMVTVQEESYAVIARVEGKDENGEDVPRSERLERTMRLAWSAEARCGRLVQVIEDEEGPAAVVELGDAPEVVFEETAGAFLEVASSW